MIRGRDEQTRECGEKPPASVDKTLANKGAPNLSVKPVQHPSKMSHGRTKKYRTLQFLLDPCLLKLYILMHFSCDET